MFKWVRRLITRIPSVQPVAVPTARSADGAAKYEDLAEKYWESIADSGLSYRTIRSKRSTLKHITAALAGRELGTIRPWEVARIVKTIHDKGLFVTSRQVLYQLNSMFDVAILEGWIDTNPATPVKRPPAPVKRQRMTLEQWHLIHDYGRENFPPWFFHAMRLALVTGQRRADIATMHERHVRDGHLFVVQQKTGARIAIPLGLRMDALGCTVGDVVRECMLYAPTDGGYLLRSPQTKRQVAEHSLSNRFWNARKAVCPHTGPGTPTSFHEIRSLSARLYRLQGVDTQTLLGHAKASMTEIYEDDRGLTKDAWRYVSLPASDKLPP